MPSARRTAWASYSRGGLTVAITQFSLRSLLRSRQHRTILSLYVGVGVVIGGLMTRDAVPGVSGIDMRPLILSMLGVILTIVAVRVVSAVPISLRANWIMRITQVRPAGDYQGAVRFSWLLLCVTPVLFVITGVFLTLYPWRYIPGHVGAMLLLAILIVELCLISFPKIPFTCSYLPGKAKIHFVFWGCLFLFIPALGYAAEFEGRMLSRPGSTILMIAVLAVAAALLYWIAQIRSMANETLTFEEENPAEIVSLKLNQ